MMTRTSLILSTLQCLMLAAAIIGCGKQSLTPRHLVILIDVSGSIEPRAREEAFRAIDQLIAHMQRGDSVAVIPITGDAQAETSGRIIRFQVPISRQAYDSDLRQFRSTLQKSLDQFKILLGPPGTRTDILGSVALAEQEFKFDRGNTKQLLVVLSDFIQDDSDLNFLEDSRFVNKATARDFAIQSAKTKPVYLRGIPTYLGLVRSKDAKNITRTRREAIQAFWKELLTSAGAKVDFEADGTGLLNTFVTFNSGL